jgi:putative tryptophan/tyrosine transport system substrate-binding protein
MRRRDFIGLVGGAAAWPLTAHGQQAGPTYRIAYFGPSSFANPPQRAMVKALGELGFVEGENLELDTLGSGLRPGEYAQVAPRLVEAKPDLIVCGGHEPAKAAQQATKSIPLLVNADDMVGEGLVSSIARPGGNTTGVSILSEDLDGKRFEILLELLLSARRIDALAGSDAANPEHFAALQGEAQRRGIELIIRTAGAYAEIASAIEAAKAAGAAGLNVLGSALLFGNRQVIFERTAALGLPAIYQWPENAHEGGLIGYGPSEVRIYEKQLSRMAAEILRGAKPADIPIEHPTLFDLAINMKTAKALGLTIPVSILASADEVIE